MAKPPVFPILNLWHPGDETMTISLDNQTTFLHFRSIDTMIGLIAKRTYSLEQGKICLLHEKQEPLIFQPVINDQDYLEHDWDAVIRKEMTDVVLKAGAFVPGGEKQTRLDVAMQVAGHRKDALVFGNRVAHWNAGAISFSEPEPFSSMPLNYTLAYGGSDEKARASNDQMGAADLQKYVTLDLSKANLCVYPRNSAGKGYVLANDERIEGLVLPNIEDPDDLLTPERLVVPQGEQWYRQPLPAGFDFFDYNWFPRHAFSGFGLLNFSGHKPESLDLLREIQLGYIKPEDLDGSRGLVTGMTERYLNAASPGLSLPYLKGNETIRLWHMDPDHPEFVFHLPDDVPRMFIRPLDEKKQEVTPRLYTVLIEKEKNQVSLIWGGTLIPRLAHGPEQIAKVEHSVNWK